MGKTKNKKASNRIISFSGSSIPKGSLKNEKFSNVKPVPDNCSATCNK